MGMKEGINMIAKTFSAQKGKLEIVFIANLCKSCSEANKEQISYIIFIFVQMLDKKLLSIPKNEENKKVFRKDSSFDEIKVDAESGDIRELILTLFEKSEDWADLILLLKQLEKETQKIYDEKTILRLLNDFQHKTYIFRGHSLPQLLPLYSQYFRLLQNSLLHLREDDDVIRYREDAYYDCRESLVACMIFFYYLDFLSDQKFMDNMSWMFDNLSSDNICIADHQVFLSLLCIPTPYINYLHKFHYTKKKLSSVVTSSN